MLSHWHTHTHPHTQTHTHTHRLTARVIMIKLDRFHLCTSASRRRAPCSEWLMETSPSPLSPSFSLNGYLTIDLSIHPFVRPVRLIQPHVQSVRLVRTGGLGVCAPPPPHTSSMSGMPAMLRCVSTFIPRLVKKKKKKTSPHLSSDLCAILCCYLDYVTSYDLSVIWGQILRFTVYLLAAASLWKSGHLQGIQWSIVNDFNTGGFTPGA